MNLLGSIIVGRHQLRGILATLLEFSDAGSGIPYILHISCIMCRLMASDQYLGGVVMDVVITIPRVQSLRSMPLMN